MPHKIFCMIVMIIQLFIAGLNYFISREHSYDGKPMHATIDFLCGVSWTITGLYWGWYGMIGG